MPKGDGCSHAGHRQRMRGKYRSMGIDNFPPHEVLEMILYYSIPVRDVNPLAHNLIDKFGSVYACIMADESELLKVKGVGKKTAKLLTTLGQACELYASYRDNRLDLSKFPLIVQYIRRILALEPGEQTWAICMDKIGRLVGARIISRTGWYEESIYKDALKAALKYYASAIILVDKRDTQFSGMTGDDIYISEGLTDFMARIGIMTLDMIIVSDEDIISLRQSRAYSPMMGLREGDDSLAKLYTHWLD